MRAAFVSFLARNLEIIVSAIAFGAITAWAVRTEEFAIGSLNGTASIAVSALVGGYIGYLAKCYREGRDHSESGD